MLRKDKNMENIDIEKILHYKKVKRMGSLVFCVGCGAKKRTLRRWHNSYLCTDCYKTMLTVGDENYIKALKGETNEKDITTLSQMEDLETVHVDEQISTDLGSTEA